MKPLLRLLPRSDHLRTQIRCRSTFICKQCRQRALHPSLAIRPTSYVTHRQASSGEERNNEKEKIPYTEKLRRKIWGTDLPPGQKDPYAKLSPEQRQQEIEERELQRAERDLEEENERLATEGKITPAVDLAATTEVVDEEVDDLILNPEQGYISATTADGLERLGGATGWWEDAWDNEHQYHGFIPATKASAAAMEGLTRRALIETLLFSDAGLPLDNLSRLPVHSNFDYERVALESVHGQPQLNYAHADERQQIVDTMLSSIATDAMDSGNSQSAILDQTFSNEEEEFQDPASAAQSFTSEDMLETERPSWLRIQIQNDHLAPEFRFAFLKRVMQLTGVRIPDPVIPSLRVAWDVLGHVRQKPKPKKLAEILLTRSDLISLPNVEVFDRRHTPIDKEKEVGRWKIIEQELQKRGLPITGKQ